MRRARKILIGVLLQDAAARRGGLAEFRRATRRGLTRGHPAGRPSTDLHPPSAFDWLQVVSPRTLVPLLRDRRPAWSSWSPRGTATGYPGCARQWPSLDRSPTPFR